MKLIALTWLYKELKRTKINLARAMAHRHGDDERRNLQTKIDILEWFIDLVMKENG